LESLLGPPPTRSLNLTLDLDPIRPGPQLARTLTRDPSQDPGRGPHVEGSREASQTAPPSRGRGQDQPAVGDGLVAGYRRRSRERPAGRDHRAHRSSLTPPER